MRSNCVAVLDIRSSEMTAVVGERGVNGTFVIKSKYSCVYDGFAESEIIDVKSFTAAVNSVVKSTLASNRGIKSFYVSVPGEFLKLVNTDKVISFQSKKKINAADVRALTEISKPADDGKWRTIRHSCLYYVISDKRKLIDPIGAVSDSLQGRFGFYKCANSFIGCLMDAFKKFREIAVVNLIPSDYAQAMYLIEPEERDKCAVLFDLGYISSTYSVVCGNGLLYSESFSVGVGHIALYLMSELDIPYDIAYSMLSSVNLNAKDKSRGGEFEFEGKKYNFSARELKDKIREGLDGVCETIEECRSNFIGKNIDDKPLLITGEGVKVIRGASDHISGRLVKAVEILTPKVPFYDKPQFSSLLSLLDTALGDAKK